MSVETSTPVETLVENISQVLLGKESVVRLSVTALLGSGHLLIEDAPGVGKTSLAKALSQSLQCEYTRLQCTPDMLPSDILGSSVFLPNTGEFEFRQGPIFTNILLADEINRTSPRTQSALLEAMSEFQVSIDGQTYPLHQPFFVLATQNPYEFEGTYPLPENQLDRFMLCIEIGYPSKDVEMEVLRSHRNGEPVEDLSSVLDLEQLLRLREKVHDVRVDESINEYLLSIVHTTREHEQLSLGVSTRGAVTFYRALQAYAMVQGRDYVIPDDVKDLAIPVLAHRVVVGGLIRETQRLRAQEVIQQIVDTTTVPN